jgi:hypothetical protein
MKRALLIFAAVALGWWLFGVRIDPEMGVRTVAWRWFGRYTCVDIFWEREGMKGRSRYLFPWSEPFTPGSHPNPITSCHSIPETWEDWDGDGKWDIWMRRMPPDARGECATEYRIDLDRDETPDWKFIAGAEEWEETRRRIVARRGW